MNRKKLNNRIESIVLISAALISGLIAIFDLFGLLDEISWLVERTDTLVLLVLSVLLGSLIFDRRRDQILQEMLEDLQLGKLSSLQYYMDENLIEVFGEHISGLLQSIEMASKNKEIRLHDMELFRYFYKRTLDVFPKSEFLATSIPSKNYFWKNNSSEDGIRNFIENGGKMRRVFFIDVPLNELEEDAKEIIQTQLDIGVETYITQVSNTPNRLRKFFFVDNAERIAWEVFIGASNDMISIIMTSDKARNKEYKKIFDSLMKLPTTIRVSKL